MFVNKLIIVAVVLCLILSLANDGLVSASLDLCAFTLLLYYLYKQRASKY